MGDDSKLAKILREAPREKIAISIVEGGMRRERVFAIKTVREKLNSISLSPQMQETKSLLENAISSNSFRFTGAEVEKGKKRRKKPSAEPAAQGPAAAAAEAQVLGILSAIEQGSGSPSNSKANPGPDLAGNAQAPLPKTRRHGTTLEPMNLHSRHRAALPKAPAPSPKSSNPAPAIPTAPAAEKTNGRTPAQPKTGHETGSLPSGVRTHFQTSAQAGNQNEILLQKFTQAELEAITRALMGVANSTGRVLGRPVKSDVVFAYFRFLKNYFLGTAADSDALNLLEPAAMRKMVEQAKSELSNKGFGGLTPLGAQRLESFMEQKHIAPPPTRQPPRPQKTANKV